MPQPYSNPALPKDSIVVISGVNGFIGSHIAEEALEAGLRVRGTVRNPERAAWTTKFFSKYGEGRFSLVQVPNMGASGAFDEAVKGAAGFVHTASDLSFSKNPNDVIPNVISGMKSALSSAAKEPSIKRFVYTSSSTAALTPRPNEKIVVGKDTWNEETVKAAWKEPFDDEGHEWLTYGASKTEGEKAAWEFVRENKPGFVLNAVLPNANFGSMLDESQFGASTAGWISAIFGGNADPVKGVPPQYFVDVSDDARLHIAALLNPDVQNERIFAFAEPFNFTEIFQAMRKLYPDRNFPEDIPDEGHDLSTVPNKRAAELLKAFGQDGFTPLSETLKKHCDRMISAGK